MNAHLNYVTTATGIDVWNDDPEYVIDVIPDFTKPDIEDHRNQGRQLEDAMVAEIVDSSVRERVVVTGVVTMICKLF